MIVLNIMMRQRLKRSTKKLSTAFFRTVQDDRRADAVDPYATVHRLYCSYYKRSKLHLQPVAPGIQNCLPGYLQHHRFYCTKPSEELPLFTDLPKRTQPRLLSGIKFVLINFLAIKPQLDPEFSLKEFLSTTNKESWVVQVVSNRLATCDYEALEEMVTPHVFEQIKKNLPYFTEKQREKLTIQIEDVAVSYIDDMKIDDVGVNGTEKHLQITTVHHVLKGAAELRKMLDNFTPFSMAQSQQQGSMNPMEELQQKRNNLEGFVTNFSFSRTYNVETGTAGDWIINGLNFYARKVGL